MNILGIILTIAFILWMPVSIVILWLIYRANKAQKGIMQETLVVVAEKVAGNTHSLMETSKRLSELELKRETTPMPNESDVPPQ